MKDNTSNHGLSFLQGLFCLSILLVTASAWGQVQTFGPTDLDAVYTDRTAVQYEVSRVCLADLATCLDEPGLTSACSLSKSIVSQGCTTGIHRFCLAKGHRSGFGIENAGNPGRVDITCLRHSSVELQNVDPSVLAARHGGCSTPTTSLTCNVAIDRHCRSQAGFSGGFGPLEIGAQAMVACVADAAIEIETPSRSAVEGLVPGCNLGASPTPTACRQAMDLHCRAQGSDWQGAFGPLELGGIVRMACVDHVRPWEANSELPESPALPVDIVSRPIHETDGTRYSADLTHNALAASRTMTFDGRVFMGMVTVDGVRHLSFRTQTPEIFEVPLSQRPVPKYDRAFETGFWGAYYGEDVVHTEFHAASGGTFEGKSAAICDPHRGMGGFEQANRQQSVPGRVSNPFACDQNGNEAVAGNHDCYDVTVVSVYERSDGDDELWGRPVRLVVTNPKGSGTNGQQSSLTRSHVVKVVTWPDRPAQKSPFPLGDPGGILEPTISGDGRLIVIQGDGMIRYAVIPQTGDACDVTRWTEFKHLYEMHTDPDMQGYGLAKFPIRDYEGQVLHPSVPGNHRVRAAYPWIDRDGDNMMFMLGRSPLFYYDSNNQVHEKFEVLSHPFFGTAEQIPCGPGCTVPLHLSTPAEVMEHTDDQPREGLTFVGLWTQGKFFTPDSRNNAADFGIPGGPAYHRNLALYSDVPEGTEVGTNIRTSINSSENQFFYRPELRPDTPREVVWVFSTQDQTDEVAFDDVLDPRALIVSPMNVSIASTGSLRGRFNDGFVYTGKYRGEGFQHPAQLANLATPVSSDLVAAAPELSGHLQWNAPTSGLLLGGARSEPIAAGGIRSRGLWLDGADDRLDYLVPEQPQGRLQDMSGSPWFYNLSFDPRDLSTARVLFTAPDGTWLRISNPRLLQFGRPGAPTQSLTLPAALELRPREWTTLGILSQPQAFGAGQNQVRLYVDGFLFATVTHAEGYFRMEPGRLTLGAESGGFRGWLDDFKVLGRAPSVEEICNHARGTLIGIEPGDDLAAVADAFPGSSHQAISNLLPMERRFATYACERPIPAPVDLYDQADHSHYACLGQTRRLDEVSEPEKCLRHDLLFPEGPLFVDLPRPSSLGNGFCLSCHVDSNPSVTMQRGPALAPGAPGVAMPDDIRRQPMQHPPKFFGNVPAGHFGLLPLTTFQTPEEGTPLDPYTTPASPPSP